MNERDSNGYRELFEHAPLGYQSLSTEGIIIQVNQAWCKMFGYEREQVIGRSFADFLLPDEVADFLYRFGQVKDKGEVHGVEIRILHKDGKKLLVSIEARAVYGVSGETKGTYAILTDLSERQQAEARLRETMLHTVKALARTLEKRDPYTSGHQERVGAIAALITQRLGLDENLQQGIRLGGIIHDIGKIYVPSEILTRPGRLTAFELGIIRTHPEVGYEIVKDIDFPWPIAEMIFQHHERLDGSGYPRGLAGDDIILAARILAVADVLEAMVSMRPYRPALGISSALEELREGSGRIYDSGVVRIAMDMFTDGDVRSRIARDIFGQTDEV